MLPTILGNTRHADVTDEYFSDFRASLRSAWHQWCTARTLVESGRQQWCRYGAACAQQGLSSLERRGGAPTRCRSSPRRSSVLQVSGSDLPARGANGCVIVLAGCDHPVESRDRSTTAGHPASRGGAARVPGRAGPHSRAFRRVLIGIHARRGLQACSPHPCLGPLLLCCALCTC